MKKIFFMIAIFGLFIGGCNHRHDHDHNHEHNEHDHEDHAHENHTDEGEKEENENVETLGNTIIFTHEQAGKIDFATALPVKQNFGQVIKTTAQIQSSQDDENIISARTSGIVMMEGNSIVEGKNVSGGQYLFSISGAGMADNNANVRFIEAQANYLKAKEDYERAQDLVKEKIVSDKDFLQIKSTYETSKAVYDNLHKNFSANGQRVASPGNGYIKQLFVSNGQFVSEGQALLRISKNKTLILKADVQSKYVSILPFISSANIRSTDKKMTYSLEDMNGKLLSFGKSLSNDNYMIPVSFQIDNKAGFIPGSFVEIFIRTKSEKQVLTIPNDALTEEQGVFFVYVQLAPEHFEKREVKTGVTDGICTEIISGISDSDEVVIKGAISVKLAQASGVLDPHAGHVH